MTMKAMEKVLPAKGRGGSWFVTTEGNKKDRNLTSMTCPPVKNVFWRKTFCEPLAVEDDVPFVHAVSEDCNTSDCAVETEFDLI